MSGGSAIRLATPGDVPIGRAPAARLQYLGTGEDDVGARALYEGLGFNPRGGHATGPVNDFYEREV
jgi:hypothetical protein